MKPHAAVCAILAATALSADPLDERRAAVGDYVVVRAGLLGCSQLHFILAAPEVKSDGTVELPGLRRIAITGRTEAEIDDRLGRLIATERPHGDMPRTLRVELIPADEYATIGGELLTGRRFLEDGGCESLPDDQRREERPEWQREQELRWLEQHPIAALPHANSVG